MKVVQRFGTVGAVIGVARHHRVLTIGQCAIHIARRAVAIGRHYGHHPRNGARQCMTEFLFWSARRRLLQQLVDAQGEKAFGISAAVDVGIGLVAHRVENAPAHIAKVADVAVVHEQILLIAERMAVGFVDARGLGGGAHVGEDAVACHHAREVVQIAIVPRRCDGAEHCRFTRQFACIPTDAEAVAVQRLFAFTAVGGLTYEGMSGFEQQTAQADIGTEIEREATHRRSPRDRPLAGEFSLAASARRQNQRPGHADELAADQSTLDRAGRRRTCATLTTAPVRGRVATTARWSRGSVRRRTTGGRYRERPAHR